MTPDRLAAFDALTPNGRALVAALRYESQVAGIADTGQYVEWLERHVLAARDDAAQLRETLYAVQSEAENRVRCMESEGESSELRRAIDAARGVWEPRTIALIGVLAVFYLIPKWMGV